MRVVKMKQVIILFLLSIVSIGAIAQNIELKGRVVDAENGKPVEFANIGVVGTYLGTASDFDGFYQLIVGESFVDYKVQISAVGYQAKEFTVDELFVLSGEHIKLFPQTYGIKQVEVKADSKRLYGILKTASNIIEDSYVRGYSANVYYSQQLGEDITEAVIKYSDGVGYGDRSLVSAYEARNYEIVEVRRNYEVSPIKKGMILANDVQNFDVVRQRGNILDVDFVDDYALQLMDETILGEDSVWVIQYKLNNPDLAKTGDAYCSSYKGLIYIRQQDYIVLRNELEIVSTEFFHAGRDAFRGDGLVNKDYKYKVVANYTTTDNDKIALSKITYSGTGTDLELDLEWIVYDYAENRKGFKKSFYSDKASNEDFWNRFELPTE